MMVLVAGVGKDTDIWKWILMKKPTTLQSSIRRSIILCLEEVELEDILNVVRPSGSSSSIMRNEAEEGK